MIIGDDWLTKAMLINTLSRSSKLQSQTGTTSSEFGNLLSAVLNQLLTQQVLPSTDQSMPSSYTPNMLLGNQTMTPYTPNMVIGNQSMMPYPPNIINGNQTMTPNVPNMVNGDISLNSDEPLRFQSINSDKINQVLDGKLKGMGEVFVRAGQRYNIDSALLTAIAQHETGNGKSHAAIEKNNIAGMMGSNGLKSYASVEESIMDMARNLKKNYLGSGLSSISKIAGKYAPIGAGNDPNGLNNHWVTGVTKYFERLKV